MRPPNSPSTLVVAAPLAAVLSTLGACDLLCDTGSYEAYVFDEQRYAGQVTGAGDGWQLAREAGYGGIEACARYHSPGQSCAAVRFCLQTEGEGLSGAPALAVCLEARQASDGARLALPDPSIEVDARLDDGTALRTTSGQLRLAISRGAFEAGFDLELVAEDGRRISVRDGRYAWRGGHDETRCFD